MAGETEPAAPVVEADEVAERVRLAVHVMTRGAADPALGERQGGRRRRFGRDAGLVRRPLVPVTCGAARLQVRREQVTRGRRVGVERRRVRGVARLAAVGRTVHVVAVRARVRDRSREEHEERDCRRAPGIGARGGVHAAPGIVVVSRRRCAMREIVDGILTWSWLSEPHGYNFNGYLVHHPDGNLCIDPVEPSAEVLDRLAKEGVARILISNRNHVRRANLVRERTGAPVAIHPADAPYARQQGAVIDAELHAGQRVGPFAVVGVPGKSPGEVAFHCPRRRVLIVGDAIIGNPPGKLSLLREKVLDDPARLRGSVAALAELEVDVLLPGDGEPILRDAGNRLRELVATFPA